VGDAARAFPVDPRRFFGRFSLSAGARKWVSTLGGRPGAESTAPFDRATPTFYRSPFDSERLRRAVFEISRSKGSKGDVLTDRALAYDGARRVIAPFVRGPASRVFVNRTRSHARRSPLLLASSQRTLKISAENGRFFVGFSAVEFLPPGLERRSRCRWKGLDEARLLDRCDGSVFNFS
jgi:hypothetical protein